ncbi:MAG: hypothetical protein AAGH89_10200, partial [Verrucomicrobiota bacterium]
MKKLPFIFLSVLLVHCPSFGQSNSKGPNSPVVVGVIVDFSKDRDSVTILQEGQYHREIPLGQKTKVSFVGMPKNARELTVGYVAKASLKGGNTKSLKVTLPVKELKSLGENRARYSIGQILEKADDDGDNEIDYVEMSRWIYHSGKHGPDHFEKADASKNGALDEAELENLLAKVTWWRLSRKTVEEWMSASDENGDGLLGEGEFTGINGGDGHIESRFRRADKSGDEKLSPEEVASYLAA